MRVVLLLLLAGCATTSEAPREVSPNGDAPEIADLRARFPTFYEQIHGAVRAEFHGDDVAARARLGPGRWRVVVRVKLDYTGLFHGAKLLRSSGFNALDDEAVAACGRVAYYHYPPDGAIDLDSFAYVPVQLVVEVGPR